MAYGPLPHGSPWAEDVGASDFPGAVGGAVITALILGVVVDFPGVRALVKHGLAATSVAVSLGHHGLLTSQTLPTVRP